MLFAGSRTGTIPVIRFMRILHLLTPLFSGWMFFSVGLNAADRFTVTVSNDMESARPAETIAVSMEAIKKRIPDVLIDHLVVKNPKGKIIPSQVTNFNQVSPTPEFDDLLWQYDFAAGEKTVTFTVEKSTDIVAPFPAKVFARYVPERLDDFAWENDRIAHRMYGQRLDSPEAGQSRMTSSGIDVWLKSVSYPVIDRWYLKGTSAYHSDSGEGLDMYDVGSSRGCGGTGIWDGKQIHVSKNYRHWRVLANGPIRAVFELSYDAWNAGDVQVSEKKRFTVDAGQNLHRIESTFVFRDAKSMTVAVGLAKPPKNAVYEVNADVTAGWLANWATYKQNGSIGIGAVIPGGKCAGLVADDGNSYLLAAAESGIPLCYYIGAAWSNDGSGRIKTKKDWEAYLADFAERLKHPLKITLSDAENGK